ncbi:hypothetical protein [Anaerolactibacter massiliensis]|uniref:hypothetical protein n=1 Tax=Anaerolactibacter massiliensis TaxID=2044573 RepID=UPI000CF8FE11|nr:hypothetical protein [Anaerolactibacter massiliensis]
MKIRTDFVTNSSSSSFVAINIASPTLENYLKEHGLSDLFQNIESMYCEDNALTAELRESFSESLCNILKQYDEETSFEDFDDDDSEEENTEKDENIQQLIKFIKKNKSVIDYEMSGSIELKASISEDGWAYAQKLNYTNHEGELEKWPPVDNGWDTRDGKGYDQICQYSSHLMDGDIDELADLKNDDVFDIIWDQDDLCKAIERTGIIKRFNIKPPKSTV